MGIEYDEFVITGDKNGYCREQAIEYALDDDAADYYPNMKQVHLSIVCCNR